MNWLARARREIRESARQPTAKTDKTPVSAVMAVPHPGFCKKLEGSIGSFASTPPARMLETDSVREDFEERAAIMEFDGGMSRDEAECAAWAPVLKRHQLH